MNHVRIPSAYPPLRARQWAEQNENLRARLHSNYARQKQISARAFRPFHCAYEAGSMISNHTTSRHFFFMIIPIKIHGHGVANFPFSQQQEGQQHRHITIFDHTASPATAFVTIYRHF